MRGKREAVDSPRNVRGDVVEAFGDEWSRFDQAPLAESELHDLFERYFRLFPWKDLSADAIGFDAGCGTGRWARFVAPRVGKLVCVDASPAAVAVAEKTLAAFPTCEVHLASIENLPLPENSADFGYSLGVLHHIPDTAKALRACVARLKPGAPFLVYLYYAFDNRATWFRLLWRLSEPARFIISRLPRLLRFVLADILALLVYWPLARLGRLMEMLGLPVDTVPLSYYRHRSFYVMRNDALDRFGTRLEQRFTREQIKKMMLDAGLQEIEFSVEAPYWCAVGRKSSGKVRVRDLGLNLGEAE